MATTANGFPYPQSNATANVPADIQALAQKVDTEYAARYIQTGASGTITLAANTLNTLTVTFPKAYLTTPSVQLTCSGASGGVAGLAYFVSAKSATGFTISAQKTAAGGVAFDWQAVGAI